MEKELPINLQEYPHLNEKLLCELNMLLSNTQGQELRKSLQQLLFAYLQQSHDIRSYDFKEVMHHLQLLMEFFDQQ